MVKKRYAYLAAVILICLLLLEGGASANPMSGFRGIRWGQDIKTFNDLKYVDEYYGMSYYRKLNDRLYIGDTSLNDIMYAFRGGKFSGVVLQTTGHQNARLLYETLKSTYGTPYNLTGDNHYWRFSHMWIFYNYNQYSHLLHVSYMTDDAVMSGGGPTPFFQRLR